MPCSTGGNKPVMVNSSLSSKNCSGTSPPAEGIPTQHIAPPKSWSDIVSTSSSIADFSLSYHPPSSSMEGQILIKPPAEVLKRGNQLWASSLIGHFLQSKLPFKVVEPIVRRLWGNKGLMNVFLHDKGFYIFKF